MKRVCVLTATRAEYGLLKPLIEKLNKAEDIEVKIVVTGAHLSPEFGLTYREIENDGYGIDKKIEMLLSSDTPAAISKSMGLAMISFADYFADATLDLLVVLGDRYETLAVATVAMNQRIPIAHLYGGEATEGLVDETIRHSITKMSYLHFTSTERYRERVIQLGEHPSRVFNVGSLGIENIKNEPFLSKSQLGEDLQMDLDKPFAVVTFHPVTLEKNSAENQISELLRVAKDNKRLNYIFTKANSDVEGRIINRLIDDFVNDNNHCKSFDSLGLKRYLSAVKYSRFVMGNSSSGILEVPYFNIPTINIGDRQKGRIQGGSIINCAPTYRDIQEAIILAESEEFRHTINNEDNPYNKDGTSEEIVMRIRQYINKKDIDLKKCFYDIGEV